MPERRLGRQTQRSETACGIRCELAPKAIEVERLHEVFIGTAVARSAPVIERTVAMTIRALTGVAEYAARAIRPRLRSPARALLRQVRNLRLRDS